MSDTVDTTLFTTSAPYADPAAWHAAVAPLRRASPVVALPNTDIAPIWAVLGHAEVLEVERQAELFTNSPACSVAQANAVRSPHYSPGPMKLLVEMDGDEHQAHRLIISKWFLPASIRRLDESITARADEAVQTLVSLGGECDFAQDIAVHYPLRVIMSLFGIPDTDYDLMLTLTQALMEAQDPETNEQASATMLQFFEYFERLANDRRSNPTDDLASIIANATIDGEPVDALGTFGLYLIVATAGHDTTSSAVAGGLEALIEHPDQLDLLRTDTSLIENAAEEMIRYVSPVKHFLRTAQADYELAGETISKGDRVLLSYPAANRDERVFELPDQFEIRRSNADQHIAFGFGRHFCLGSHLARLETRKFYEHLLPRLESIESTGPCKHLASNMVSGPASQPIRYRLRG